GPVGNSSAKRPDLDVEKEDFHPEDLSKFSAKEILYAIQQRNKDPIIDQMLEALVTKLPQEISEGIDAEKRARSLVISGLPEAPVDMRPSARQDDLDSKVCKLLDILRVECRPLEIYRLGKLADSLPRLVKLVLPSRSHWATALSNSRLLRDSEFANVYIRKSMTPAERKRDYELRTECKERNKRANARVWVVYRTKFETIFRIYLGLEQWETSKQTLIDWSTNTAKCSGSSTFLELSKLVGFTQNVMGPTRGESILDIILTSTPLHGLVRGLPHFSSFSKLVGSPKTLWDLLVRESILDIYSNLYSSTTSVSIKPPLASSDHSTVAFQFQIQLPLQEQLTFPNFNKADYGALSSYLISVNRFCGVVHSVCQDCSFTLPTDAQASLPKHLLNLLSQKTRLFHTLPNALIDPVYKKFAQNWIAI
ncbi:hypothetical protein COOONC_01955, partial [Cooperia oncophora]